MGSSWGRCVLCICLLVLIEVSPLWLDVHPFLEAFAWWLPAFRRGGVFVTSSGVHPYRCLASLPFQALREKQAAELREVAVREETATRAKVLEAGARRQRETVEREAAESLVRALEEMERQQSGVLSAALARSDAALGEIARVKEVGGCFSRAMGGEG